MTHEQETALRDVHTRHDDALVAAAQASAARAVFAMSLADAQDTGLSVRQLADALDVQPTTVQRLIAAARAEA